MKPHTYIDKIVKEYGGDDPLELKRKLTKLNRMIRDDIMNERKIEKKRLNRTTDVKVIPSKPEYDIPRGLNIKDAFKRIEEGDASYDIKVKQLYEVAKREANVWIMVKWIPEELFNDFFNAYYDCADPKVDFDEDRECAYFKILIELDQ